jgi:hypothetical protein
MADGSEVAEYPITHLKLVGNFQGFGQRFFFVNKILLFLKRQGKFATKSFIDQPLVLLYFTTRTRTVHSLLGKKLMLCDKVVLQQMLHGSEVAAYSRAHLKLVGNFRKFGQRFLFVNKLLSVQVPKPLAVESDL